jgi:hypothetical protein
METDRFWIRRGFFGEGGVIQGLVHVRQTLYHSAVSPDQEFLFGVMKVLQN